MTGLVVTLILLAILVLILALPVGGEVEYSSEGVLLCLRAGPLNITLYPRKKKDKTDKEKKPKKQKKSKQDKKTDSANKEALPKKKGGSFELIRQLLPIVLGALGRLKGKLRIWLTLYYTAAGEDAAKTAIQFGSLSAGLGAIVPLLENHFRIVERDIRASVDFTITKPILYLHAKITIRIGQVLYIAIRYGIACLVVYLRHRKANQPAAEQSAEQNTQPVSK